ncbi:MAG: YdeI/OmpD-associated family protein, partial [Cytophagales bacterium]
SRAAWRQWLKNNHTQPDSVWVVIAKKESGLPSITNNEMVEEALCFGWIDSVPNKLDAQRFKVLVSPRKAKSNWSQVNKDRATKMIKAGLMQPAGLAMIELAKKSGTWNALDEINSLILPPDLTKALGKNKKANSFFDQFPPSAKRGILEWIQNAKTEETRSKRIAETVTLAAKNIRANQYRQPKTKLNSEAK